MRTLTQSDIDRFWAKVDKVGPTPAHAPDLGPCWEWAAAKSGSYGAFKIDGKAVKAHRISFMLSNGPIPDSAQIDHECQNKSCVNPPHLRLATNKQNAENQPKAKATSASGVRGVGLASRGKPWRVQVKHNGKNHYGGAHLTIQEAEKAAIALRNSLFTHNACDR